MKTTKRKSRTPKILTEAGDKRLVQFEDQSAIIVQHETDHLDGVCKIGEK